MSSPRLLCVVLGRSETLYIFSNKRLWPLNKVLVRYQKRNEMEIRSLSAISGLGVLTKKNFAEALNPKLGFHFMPPRRSLWIRKKTTCMHKQQHFMYLEIFKVQKLRHCSIILGHPIKTAFLKTGTMVGSLPF